MTFEDAVWIVSQTERSLPKPSRRHEVDECGFCQQHKGQMHPSHDASARCESGKHEHCTCDVCF